MDAAGARALKDRIEAHQATVASRLRAIARVEQPESGADTAGEAEVGSTPAAVDDGSASHAEPSR